MQGRVTQRNMVYFSRVALVFTLVALCACARHASTPISQGYSASCADRATSTIAANVWTIAKHRYGEASRAAEQAARISLACADDGSAATQFADRWRAANALVVAAELAHQANDPARAHRLLHEGYAIMHSLRPPEHVSALTSTLIAQKLDTARRDLHGQWAYW